MSIRCRNGSLHTHESVNESRRCWGVGLPAAPVAASRPVPPPPAPPAPAKPAVRMVSQSQLDYVTKFNGDYTYASKLTYDEAFAYVGELMRAARDRKKNTLSDPRLDMIKGMINLIPEGNYATQLDGNSRIDFLRVTRPTKGQYRGSVKFQTRHSDNLDLAAVLWPSGAWSLYKQSVIDMMLLMIADSRGCMRRFAQELGRCCNCGKSLTDERSRYYGIGPECEKDRPDVIEYVDDMNSGVA